MDQEVTEHPQGRAEDEQNESKNHRGLSFWGQASDDEVETRKNLTRAHDACSDCELISLGRTEMSEKRPGEQVPRYFQGRTADCPDTE